MIVLVAVSIVSASLALQPASAPDGGSSSAQTPAPEAPRADGAPGTEPSADPAREQRARAFVFMQVEHALSADHADASGAIETTRARVNLDLLMPLTKQDTLSIGLINEYTVYNFDQGSGGDAFGEPWGDVLGNRLSVGMSHVFDEQWTMLGGVGVESVRESGAELSDSLLYSGAVGAQYTLSPSLKLGLFAAASTTLEEDPVFFAAPTVDWKIDDRWTVTTGRARAPGIGIEYTTSDRQWTIGLRTRYEAREFRLAEDNLLAPSGVGADRRVPIYLDVDWNLSEQFSFNAMLGVSVFQRLKYQDSNGDTIDRTDVDPTPYFAFGVAFRF